MSTPYLFRVDDKYLTTHGIIRLLEIFENTLIEDIGEVSRSENRLGVLDTYTVQHRINGWYIRATFMESPKGEFLSELEARLTTKHGHTFRVDVAMDDRLQALTGYISDMLRKIYRQKIAAEEKYVAGYIDTLNNPKISVKR